jgi:hypothetical protein
MHNQRIEMRPFFDREDFGGGFGVERVRSEAVNSFGRQGDQFSRAQAVDRASDRGLVVRR